MTNPYTFPVHLTVDGQAHDLQLDTRVTLLDALRDHLGNMSPKKGCDHGQCGACTVLVEGERVLSCLCLAASYDGAQVTTASGLAPEAVAADQFNSGALHPVQQSFLEHDGFQCGYCTPGQICSAVAMLDEVAAGMPSVLSGDLSAAKQPLSDDEIRERMSGNLCRCGAYANMIPAIREVAQARGISTQEHS